MAYWLIASTGQVATHAPQSMQVPSSQTDLSPSIDKAPTGHTPVQAPQPMQMSLLIVTGMKKTSFTVLLYYTITPIQNKSFSQIFSISDIFKFSHKTY